MLLAAGIAAIVSTLFGSKDEPAQLATVKQKILNNIDISAISNTVVSNKMVTQISNIANQNIRIKLDGCTVGKNFNVNQTANIKANVYTALSTKITAEMIQDIQNKIQNELLASIKQEDDKLIGILSKGLSTDAENEITTIFKQMMQSTVNIETFSKLINDNKINQNYELPCKNSVIGDNFTITQNAQIDMTVINLLNTILDQLANNTTINDFANKASADTQQKGTDFLSKAVDAFSDIFKSFWYVFLIIGALVLIIGAVIFIKLFTGDNSENSRQLIKYVMQPQQQYPQQMQQYPQQQYIRR